MKNKSIYTNIITTVLAVMVCQFCNAQQKHVLTNKKLKTYVSYFNAIDTETVKNYITNDHAIEWLSANVPLFECPDSAIEKIYYYRWWTFRKHLVQTPDGFIFTEFILPEGWAGIYNTISSAVGHQLYEGRWLRDPKYITFYVYSGICKRYPFRFFNCSLRRFQAFNIFSEIIQFLLIVR